MAEGRTDEVAVDELQRSNRMSIRDDDVGSKYFFAVDFHTCCLLIVTQDACDLCPGKYLATVFLECVDESQGYMVAASHDAEGTV